jgi:fatty acid desaturase
MGHIRLLDELIVLANVMVIIGVAYFVLHPEAKANLTAAEKRRPFLAAMILVLMIVCAGGLAAASLINHGVVIMPTIGAPSSPKTAQ